MGICTDGVGSKAVIAEMMRKYDTIGIDCIAMNVNDLLCVGARPLSLVDYIAVERADAAMLDGIAIGLAEGARQAGISISGGEIAQLRDIVRGFDLVGTAVGTVKLDRIIVGRDIRPGDRVIGLASNGLHSNGYTLARRVLFTEAGLSVDDAVPELGCPLGEELLRPTFIYVPEILELIERVPDVGALLHITGDGLLNLPRVDAEIGFVLDNLPPPPPIFELIEQRGGIIPRRNVRGLQYGDRVLRRPAREGCRGGAGDPRPAWPARRVIGHAVADPEKRVHLPAHGLVGSGSGSARSDPAGAAQTGNRRAPPLTERTP